MAKAGWILPDGVILEINDLYGHEQILLKNRDKLSIELCENIEIDSRTIKISAYEFGCIRFRSLDNNLIYFDGFRRSISKHKERAIDYAMSHGYGYRFEMRSEKLRRVNENSKIET